MSPRCSRTRASPPSTSATSQQAERCNRSTTRSPASTSSNSEGLPPMALHTELTPTEAADRLAIRELFDAYAHCADRRDAAGQKALFTDDTLFAVYMDGEGSEPSYVLHGREALTPVFDEPKR